MLCHRLVVPYSTVLDALRIIVLLLLQAGERTASKYTPISELTAMPGGTTLFTLHSATIPCNAFGKVSTMISRNVAYWAPRRRGRKIMQTSCILHCYYILCTLWSFSALWRMSMHYVVCTETTNPQRHRPWV